MWDLLICMHDAGYCTVPCSWWTKAAASKSDGVRGPKSNVLARLQCKGTCSNVNVRFGWDVTLSLRWFPACVSDIMSPQYFRSAGGLHYASAQSAK